MPRKHRLNSAVSTRRSARIERLEDRHLLAATPIQVLAAGLSGTENVALEINGAEVARWSDVGGDFASGQYVTLDYTHPTDVVADDVVVRMVDSAGGGKDLRVDGVVVGGVKYESESASTWSTGSWDSNLQAIYPAYAQSEYLYPNFGAFQYASTPGAEINVRAAGATGTEEMRLWVEGELVQTWNNIGGDYAARSFLTYTYQHPTKAAPEDIRVEFSNDGTTAGGADRNLRVDLISIDGRDYQTEAPSTFGTGTYSSVEGNVAPRFNQSESLHANGYFQYAAISSPGSTVVVGAAGSTGSELMELRLDGRVAATIPVTGGDYNNSEFVPYGVVLPQAVTLDQLSVAFVNDGSTASGTDRNLRVDGVVLDGVTHETEDITTFSTGTWRAGIGINPGFTQDDRLHGNGAFQFGQDPADAGSLSLATTQYTVDEDAGYVDIGFVRTASRGTVTIDYTTVNGTAIAGQDFTATSGTLVIRDGELGATVRVPILNDASAEGSHAFNVAADRVTGGAFLGQPRTTTVTILDDDAPNVGDGVGLLGEYYSDLNFGTKVLERTDATVGFDWGTGSPSPQAPANDFTARWTGQVQPLYGETYTFETRTDDGVRLWVDGQLLIDQWVDQSATTHSGTIALQAGVKYDIRMEMYERGGDAVAELRWASASQSLELIPSTQLYSELVVPDDGQFVAETVIASGLQQPTAIDFASIAGDDYMYISQKDGRVRLAINGVLQSGLVVDYRTPVNNVRDRGLLGMVVHPDLAANPYLYLLYTYDPPETQGQSGLAAPDNYGNRGSRLTRLTLDATNGYRTVVPGSEVVLLGTNSTWQHISSPGSDSTQNINLPPSGLLPNGEWVDDILITDSQSHTIGGLDFGPDGSLYVTNGDGASYGRVDPRAIRVQDLDSLSGKVLRINPLTGDGYADNPFFTGDVSDDRSKVVNSGLRNPFRIAVDPTTGIPYVSDVGWNTWEEINGGIGENYGWPFYEGGAGNGSQGGGGVNRQTGGYRDLSEAQAFYAAGGDAEATPPLWSRSHAAGGVSIALGDFYTGDLYPSQYDNALFFTDYGDPTIRAITLDAAGGLDDQYAVMGSVGTVIEMSMGPDGRMYYVDITGKVGRINYTPGASQGLASATPAVARGDYRPAARPEALEGAPVEASPSAQAGAFALLSFATPAESRTSVTELVETTPTPLATDAAYALLLIEGQDTAWSAAHESSEGFVGSDSTDEATPDDSSWEDADAGRLAEAF